MNAISLLIPDLPETEALVPYLRQIDATKWYTNFGPLVAKLENDLASLWGKSPPLVTSVVNCTLGLELSLVALGLRQGARVLVPSLTFAASATAVLRAGFQPVLADVDPNSWMLTPEIARAARKRHKFDCVMPVATFGCPQPVGEWDVFSRETGIPTIVDAAGAFGNQEIGELTTVVFSLHATKAFGIGEGGLVVSRNKAYIDIVRQLSNFGIDLSIGMSRFAGTNAKMSEYHAAVGLAVWDHWPQRQLLRRTLSGQYEKILKDRCPDLTLQARPVDGIYTIMQVLLPEGTDCESIRLGLKSQGIETRSWYLPLLGMHPIFSSCTSDDLPVVQALAPRMLGLPFHLQLGSAEVARICSSLSDLIRAQRS